MCLILVNDINLTLMMIIRKTVAYPPVIFHMAMNILHLVR